MTPITDAGRAHLDAIATERQANRDALQAERDAIATDPAGITVGCYVWLRRNEDSDQELRGGLVADANDEWLWLVDHGRSDIMVNVKRRGSRAWTDRPHATLRRVPLADFDRWEPRDSNAAHAAVRALLLESGIGAGAMTDTDVERAETALRLLREAQGRRRGSNA